MKVLVVEDNEVRSVFLRELLVGHTLTFAQTSTEGIEALETAAFDAVFLDLDLADGLRKGLDVAQRLKEGPIPRPRVVVHSVNIEAARVAKRILGRAEAISIIEWRRAVANGSAKRLLDRVLG